MGDWDSTVGVATYYELAGPGIESHWGGGEIFRAHPEGPEALPTSCKWLLGILWGQGGRSVVLTARLLLAPRLGMDWGYISPLCVYRYVKVRSLPLPLYTYIEWSPVKTKAQHNGT